MKKMIVGCLLVSSLSGCFMLASTPEGLRAWGDSQVGIITETRSNPDIKSGYWQNRDLRTGLQLGRQNHGK